MDEAARVAMKARIDVEAAVENGGVAGPPASRNPLVRVLLIIAEMLVENNRDINA